MTKNWLWLYQTTIVIAMIYNIYRDVFDLTLVIIAAILAVGIAICDAIEKSLGSFDIHVHNGGIESVEVDKE